jgi:hypothetical protein
MIDTGETGSTPHLDSKTALIRNQAVYHLRADRVWERSEHGTHHQKRLEALVVDSERQANGKGGAVADAALDVDSAVMVGDDAVTDAQAQAGTAGTLARSIERVEDVGQMVIRDARAVV